MFSQKSREDMACSGHRFIRGTSALECPCRLDFGCLETTSHTHALKVETIFKDQAHRLFFQGLYLDGRKKHSHPEGMFSEGGRT